MCELLAMSARLPTDLHLSMAILARHGGATGPHRDGWGIGLVDAGDAFVVREPTAAHASECLAFLQLRNPTSTIAIAHVRFATHGERHLRNTQPFSRELGGRLHLFAHNGMLPGLLASGRSRAGAFQPIGDTDSERAFCLLLEQLRPLWRRGVPDLDDRLEVVVGFAAALRPLGPANFIYSDGELVFAHGHRRRGRSGDIVPPGLHLLCRHCASPADGQEVALLASVPLTSEPWTPLAEGEVVVLGGGRVLRRVPAAPARRQRAAGRQPVR